MANGNGIKAWVLVLSILAAAGATFGTVVAVEGITHHRLEQKDADTERRVKQLEDWRNIDHDLLLRIDENVKRLLENK